jgi:hypothetical protein
LKDDSEVISFGGFLWSITLEDSYGVISFGVKF